MKNIHLQIQRIEVRKLSFVYHSKNVCLFKCFIFNCYLIYVLVCKLWKEAASKQWRKITEIDYHFKLDITFNQYLEDNNTDRESLHLPVISGKTAEKIMRQAAPFVERFAVSPYDGPEKLYLFGQYLYSVRVSDGDATLKLVAEHATNLTEVVFSHPPKTELLKFFFNVNKVKKFTFEEDSFFYKECPTDRIEKMKIKLIDIRGFTPFKGVGKKLHFFHYIFLLHFFIF